MASRQITFARQNHILTNINVWSPDGKWIVYDVRSDAEGAVFDGTRIERVNVQSGEVQVLYESRNGACCGVATFDPIRERVVFILGPEHPTEEWKYCAWHRRGVLVDCARPGVAVSLDAQDFSAPFTPGALRGGSHVHVFSPDGRRVSFTYEDHVLATGKGEPNQRNVGVSVLDRHVSVKRDHARNVDGAFSVVVTRTVANPTPGSDEISRAYEEGWVGSRRLAFIGDTRAADGRVVPEVFLVELPEDLTRAGDGPMEGTETIMPRPPAGVVQRRLTHTKEGVCGPRHWVRADRAGRRIAFLMRDDHGVAQVWMIRPNGEGPYEHTRYTYSVASAFTWSPDTHSIAYAMANSLCVVDTRSDKLLRLNDDAPLPLACVFSPDGRAIAYLRRVDGFNQVFVQRVY